MNNYYIDPDDIAADVLDGLAYEEMDKRRESKREMVESRKRAEKEKKRKLEEAMREGRWSEVF